MSQGFTKLPSKQNSAKSKHGTADDRKKKLGKGQKKIAPKRKGAILSEQIKKRFSSKINQKIEDSTIAKSIAKSGEHFTLLNNSSNKK
jgi:hypothetical protein